MEDFKITDIDKFVVRSPLLKKMNPGKCPKPSRTVNTVQISWIKPTYHPPTPAVSAKLSYRYCKLMSYVAGGSLSLTVTLK